MSEVELTNMVMVQDPLTGRVLVQDRVKSWKGLSFPGGHVEPGESFVDSAIREIYEETGLRISDLESRGVIHWCNRRTSARYIVFLYKTTHFEGEMIGETDEGRVFWLDPDELPAAPQANDFERYLPMFFGDGCNEAFGPWEEGLPMEIYYK